MKAATARCTAPTPALVPINGSHTDEEAVRLACRMSRRARGKVYVITILEVKRSVALGSVPDAEVEHAAMRQRGIQVGELLRWPGVPPMFEFKDPDGNRFEIVEEAATLVP